nr:hypothetical protein KPHV_84280 [Kitasatospora purpeofusca]
MTVTNAGYNGALAQGAGTAARDNGPGLTIRGAVPYPLPTLTCTVL